MRSAQSAGADLQRARTVPALLWRFTGCWPSIGRLARALAEMEDYRFDPGGQWGRAKHPLTEHLHTYFKERLDHE